MPVAGDRRARESVKLARDEAARGERTRLETLALVGAAATVMLFVGLYAYNTIRFDQNSLRGDQWVWVKEVLIPLEQGRMSLFEALTFEYRNLSHSHIPALGAFILNARVLGLDLTVDAIVGILSLLVVLGLVLRHCLATMSRQCALLVTAAASSLLFMSTDFNNFVWSLLQFQMFYVLVAVTYLSLFAQKLETLPPIFSLVAIPTTLVLGDAIGAGAVLASLLYLFVLVVMGRVPARRALPSFATLAISLVVFGAVLTGERRHGSLALRDFIEVVWNDVPEAARGVYFALAGGFVGLHRDPASGLAAIGWGSAWLWLLITAVLVSIAAVGLARSGIKPSHHLPIMLMLTSAIWVGGVLKSRLWLLGAEAMQAPRYAAYTSLLGLGLLLLIGSTWASLGRLRLLAGGAIAVVVVANAIGSIAVTLDDRGAVRQDLELASIAKYVDGRRELPAISGLQCQRNTPCLEAAWYLADHELGPFANVPSDTPEWMKDFRAAAFNSLRRDDPIELALMCDRMLTMSDDQLATAIVAVDGSIDPYLRDQGTRIPADQTSTAVDVYRRVITSECGAA